MRNRSTLNAKQTDSRDKAHRKVQLFAIVLLAAGLSIGCDQNVQSSTNEQDAPQEQPKAQPATPEASGSDKKPSDTTNRKETVQMQTLTVSKRVDGIETQLATITFDGANPPQLKIEAEGAEADQLQADWNELTAQGQIPLEEREVVEVEGDVVTEMNAVLVGPKEERYSDAVWSYLESNYGYIVDVDY